jgi:hypothetical protein
MLGDFMQLSMERHQARLKEGEMYRLAAQLPPRRSVVRRLLAGICHRLANWLDNANRYPRPAQSGPADWAVRPSSAYIWLTDSVTPASRSRFKKQQQKQNTSDGPTHLAVIRR